MRNCRVQLQPGLGDRCKSPPKHYNHTVEQAELKETSCLQTLTSLIVDGPAALDLPWPLIVDYKKLRSNGKCAKCDVLSRRRARRDGTIKLTETAVLAVADKILGFSMSGRK